MSDTQTREGTAPSVLPKDEALAAARELLEASPADETEITLTSVADRFVRYADSGPTQSADRETVQVSIRARYRAGAGWREARASCDGLDPRETRAALERAVELARVSPPDPHAVPLGGPVDVPPSNADDATTHHSFEQKADWVRRALEACAAEDLQPAGLCQTTSQATTLVSSTGRVVHGARSRAAFSLTATCEGGRGASGFGDSIAGRVGALDVEGAIERAVCKAVAQRNPETIDPGEYTVVLEPAAVSAILLFAAYQGFGAQDVEEQSSFLCGRIGERVLAETLSIEDNAANEVYPGLPFDGEGFPRRRHVLVERGILREPVTDSVWAARLGRENTGHSLPRPNSVGPKPANLVVAPGEGSTDDLVRGVDRGLLVTQFHYTNLIDPRDLLLTGMTRNGTFRIENGRITGAVRNLRFTESLVRAFSRITGISGERTVAGALFDGEVVCPALRIDGFRFTSTTDL